MSDRRRVSPGDPTPPSGDQRVWGDPRGGQDHFGQDSYGFGADPFGADDRGSGFFGSDSYGDDSFGADSYEKAPRGRRSGDVPPARDAYDDLYEDDAPKRSRRRGRVEEDEFASAGVGARSGRARGKGRGGDSAEPELATGYGNGLDGYDPSDGKSGDGAKRRLGVVGWVSIVLTSLLVLGTLTAYKVYRDTFGLIKRGASTDDLDKNRPVNQTGAINVLLVGSDTRAGDNAKYGKGLVNDGERTDTIMLLHVAPNRDGATLISFPRDSMVQIPECHSTQNKGTTTPAHLGMINSAFSDGGMICTRRTVETLTGIPVDHYVKVDFTGFKNIVNALGGIEICVPKNVDDDDAKLHLKAGTQTVKGETALAYVRARHSLGNGSDIDRIKRQQIFISQVVKKATSSSMLTDVGKLNGFIKAAAESVTTDDALNAGEILQIAQSAQKLKASGFKATTVPWEPYTPDPNRVQWKQPDANNLFNAIKGDTVVASATPSPAKATAPAGGTSTGTTGGTGGDTGGTSATEPITKPQQVRIAVYNGTNTGGKGKEVADELTAQGFKVVSVGNATKAGGADQPKTLVRYEGAGAASSKILTGKLLNEVAPEIGKVTASAPSTKYTPSKPPPGPKAKASGPTISLVVGADWKGIRIPLKVGGADAVTSKTNICAG
ncbi:LCP family protein [Planotetraspora kaengkrachanensis]|uniref:LytR family transcriptional regulator n=1 Tax=Planotetraspora kaengkrachanensis TaxID=575193 RepID=A0A8J3PV49_9ACTN|nr:LCP family protein [Planotetraspora kaengkrachanensis]GIG81647.1 hypothetical protein Pka01_47740 [Planotetraspora kaengkrachanensis]